MVQHLFDKEAIIIELFGSFATAIGYDISGKILIRPESLSLKLRTDWPSRTERVFSQSEDVKPIVSDAKGTEPNLAKILAVGDRVTFDAVACDNGLNGGHAWIAAQCSVKIVELCTRTKTFTSYGKVIEVSHETGLLGFDEKKIFFNSSAAFPNPVRNLTDGYKVGDIVSFVAIEQVHANEAYQWRALSVEIAGSSSAVSTVCQNSSLEPNSSHVSPPIAFPSPMSFSSTSTGKPASPRRTDRSQSRSRSRSRSPVSRPRRGRRAPRDFDRDSYYSLPVSLRGYGRVTYYGPRCSLLKDLDSHRLVFFENFMVNYPSRGRRHLVIDQIVSFKALRTTKRSNLHCYYDAERVVALDRDEEYLTIQKLQKGEHRRHSSSSSRENSRSDHHHRHPSDEHPDSCGLQGYGDLRERLSDRRNHYVDRRPFGDRVEKPLFNRRRPDYDHIETRKTHGERKNFEVVLEGDSRKCVASTNKDKGPSFPDDIDEDAFMMDEESNAQKFEFDNA